MKERKYLAFRSFFFWLLTLAFIVFAPVVVYFSLGYKFDPRTRKFLKTGVLSVKTFPEAARLSLAPGGAKEFTPCVLRELLPGHYEIALEKTGYYDYRTTVEIRPSLVTGLDVALVPKLRDFEKWELDVDIYRFFVSRHFLVERIIAFTDRGIYSLDKDFQSPRLLSPAKLDRKEAFALEGMLTAGDRLVFWSDRDVWTTGITEEENGEGGNLVPLYRAEYGVREVFLGLREKYLIIQDGRNVLAVDADNGAIRFPVYELKSEDARIFCDSRTEELYLIDRIGETGGSAFLKTKLVPLVHEQEKD